MFLLLVATYTVSLTSTVLYSVQTSVVDFSSVSTPGDITVAGFSTVTQMKPVSSVTVCDWDLKSIECVDESKIFIQSVSYGRSDDVTCLGSGQAVPACNASIDLSWLVLPDCQGKSSCDFNGSYDLQDAPCDGNKTNYFNITYVCKELDEVEIAEGSVQNFQCLPGEVIVIHYAEWRGVEVITKSKTIAQNSSTHTSKYSYRFIVQQENNTSI
ncbi:L-rhamnose-binding lectin CSL1-like [Montipora capricornis]|uniref:L-rhamnose-binding lectin CSL1-like n=1 Tax=Montipora capricornis TaxID=246305 RepID=UPI0035F17B6B